MKSNVHHLARRVEGDPFFLAHPLRLYAKSEGLDDAALAATLGCSERTLASVRLCRSPGTDAAGFQRDIDQIAEKYQLNADALADAVRRAQAIIHLSGAEAAKRATLAAARDAETEPGEAEQGGEP